MKEKYIILLLTIFLIPLKVFASGGFSVSNSNISMYPGESKTVSILSDNSVGRLNISSSNGGVASVNPGSVFVQTPGSSQSITITANSVGTSTISIVASNDYATMDEEVLSGQTRTITVNVIAKPSSNTNTNNNPINNKSKNTNLKELLIEGYELQKTDNNNYRLTVSNNVTNVNIKATPEDSKSQVQGTGNHELNVGENNIEVIVTSESGAINKFSIIITRKDGYYLEDLTSVLNDNKATDINITIDSDSKLSSDDLLIIKASGKTFKFNYYDENKILKYSWTIDSSKIKKNKELDFSITNNSNSSKKINKLSNYADGVYMNFKYSGDLPKGTKIKFFVGDKYNDNDLINIYYYNKKQNKLELINEKLKVTKGYVEYELEHCSEYFMTLSKISNIKKQENNINIFMILFIIETMGIISYITIKKNKSKNKDKFDNNNKLVSNDDVDILTMDEE